MPVDRFCYRLLRDAGDDVIRGDFNALHGRLTLRMQEELSSEQLRRMFERVLANRSHPGDYSFGMRDDVSLRDLRQDPDLYKSMPPDVSDSNFRKWMLLEFYPDPERDDWGTLHSLQCWLLAVEEDNAYRIAMFHWPALRPWMKDDDDPSTYVAHVTDPGMRNARVFGLYKDVLRLTSAEAKRRLAETPVEIARGRKSAVAQIAARFRDVGATVEIRQVQ